MSWCYVGRISVIKGSQSLSWRLESIDNNSEPTRRKYERRIRKWLLMFLLSCLPKESECSVVSSLAAHLTRLARVRPGRISATHSILSAFTRVTLETWIVKERKKKDRVTFGAVCRVLPNRVFLDLLREMTILYTKFVDLTLSNCDIEQS